MVAAAVTAPNRPITMCERFRCAVRIARVSVMFEVKDSTLFTAICLQEEG